MVLVDTTIWSLAIRRPRIKLSVLEQRLIEEWVSLVESGQAILIGPVRQEILSGIRHEKDFKAIQQRLSAFGYLEIIPSDYDQAASFFNLCRSQGVSGAPIDMLICAVSARIEIPIFTTDRDFSRYEKHLPVRLHAV